MSRLGAIFVAVLLLFYVAACDSGPRRHAVAIKPPGCSAAVASAPAARTAVRQTGLPGRPFGVVPVGDGIHALVSLSGSGAPVLAVLNIAGRIPTVQRTIMLPVGTFGAGLAISHNRRFALVTDFNGAAVIDLPGLLAGESSPILGQLGNDAASGTIEVALSKNDQYAFVSDEYGNAISVYDVAKAMRDGFGSAGVQVGDIPIGSNPVGLALAPDGKTLYAVNEGVADDKGSLVAIDVARAEKKPATAIVRRVAAGCHPGRVVLSANGRTAWVAARGSNAVLSFDTAELTLQSVVRVGTEPVGLLLVDNGRTLLVANSNRFSPTHAAGSVGVVDTAKRALTGTISAKVFPREFGYLPSRHEVLLTNFTSQTLESFQAP